MFQVKPRDRAGNGSERTAAPLLDQQPLATVLKPREEVAQCGHVLQERLVEQLLPRRGRGRRRDGRSFRRPSRSRPQSVCSRCCPSLEHHCWSQSRHPMPAPTLRRDLRRAGPCPYQRSTRVSRPGGNTPRTIDGRCGRGLFGQYRVHPDTQTGHSVKTLCPLCAT